MTKIDRFDRILKMITKSLIIKRIKNQIQKLIKILLLLLNPKPNPMKKNSDQKSDTKSHTRTQSPRNRTRQRSNSREKRKSRSRSPETFKIHVDNLTRNVSSQHLEEIFGYFGKVKRVEILMERRTNIPKGSGYIDFLKKEDAEQAISYLNHGQVDGNRITVQKTLPARPLTNPRHSPVGARRPIRRGPSPRRRRSPWYTRGSPRRSPRRRSPFRRSPRRSPGRRPYRSRSSSSSSSSTRSPVRRGNDRKSPPEKRSPEKKSPPRKRSRSASPKRRKRSSSSSSSK